MKSFRQKNKEKSSIGAVQIMKTIKIKIKNILKSKVKDFIFNSTMQMVKYLSKRINNRLRTFEV